MSHLLRSHAPITDSGWALLDDEARQRLTPALAARRLIDFRGPHGWEHSATNLGRTDLVVASPQEGVTGLRRRVLPLAELRADFTVSVRELRDQERGAVDVDLASLDDAAHRIAVAENVAVFDGWAQADITGIVGASPHEQRPLGEEPESYPRAVAGAVELLLSSGVGGPYGMALGREQYRRVVETAEHGGHLLLDHLRKILDGPIVWAPGVDGAVVLSLRGGDFIYDCGQDLAIGYSRHDDEVVHLYIEESFSFVVASPDAAVALCA
ncbi:MAG TPA: family 1 encapsulin nanocompartment shell protein [Solirubrobacteraceae bacterium]|nr:family 1 encapsulin nanocompartment shell protein [Solirubrobacteraceae bacterium]